MAQRRKGMQSDRHTAERVASNSTEAFKNTALGYAGGVGRLCRRTYEYIHFNFVEVAASKLTRLVDFADELMNQV